MRYSDLTDIYEKLESTTKHLEKTAALSEFLKKVPAKELESVILLLQGRVFPEWDTREIGIGAKLAIKAIAQVAGLSSEEVEEHWKKIGDLGKTAEHLLKKKKQKALFEEELTIKKTLENLRKIAELEGPGTVEKKVGYLADLLTGAEPKSAVYLIRTCLEELRIGAGAGIIKNAIADAFEVNDDLVELAHNLSTDFGHVAEVAKEKGEKGLEKIGLTLGNPLKVMLAQRVKDIAEGFETVGKPAAFEYKYDGFRMQVHKKGDKVVIFTRRLEEVTKQFPEIAEAIKKAVHAKEAVLEGEAIGYDPKTGKSRPFQEISQRIKRKYDIEEIEKQFPVELNIFDLIYLDGETFLETPFEERRKKLEKIVKPIPKKVVLSKMLITDNEKDAAKFYKEALEASQEGVMIKNLSAGYKPGSRVGNMVKLKPIMETLECVIVGGEWGAGKRAHWLSSFVLAVRDPETGEFLEIGKMGTGVKEKESETGVTFEQLTKMLEPLITESKGKEVKVKPKIVIEVAYEEIQKSPSYSSGFALRFPRLVRYRDDRRPDDADDLDRVKELYETQRGR